MRLMGLRYALGALSLTLAGSQVQATDDASLPQLQTNQSYIEQLHSKSEFDITDKKAVFSFVLNSLPERVSVYPTENYYYFAFHHRGVRYAGNIRLENEARDLGKVHFAYNIESTLWSERHGAEVSHILLDSTQGLTVEKLAALSYRVAYEG